MNALWTRVLRSIYKKEPITGFILTAGAVDVAIGGVDQNSSLVFFGLFFVTGALALRWWQLYNRPLEPRVSAPPERAPIGALPSQASRPSLPDLAIAKKR
jgi:hypothetical protein